MSSFRVVLALVHFLEKNARAIAPSIFSILLSIYEVIQLFFFVLYNYEYINSLAISGGDTKPEV